MVDRYLVFRLFFYQGSEENLDIDYSRNRIIDESNIENCIERKYKRYEKRHKNVIKKYQIYVIINENLLTAKS